MKRLEYIENAFIDGKYRLNFQFYGTTESTFINSIICTKHLRIRIPINHGLDETWYLCLYLSDGSKYVLDSITTNVGGWDEVGSLRITKQDILAKLNYTDVDISSFKTITAEKIIYSTKDIYAESGLKLTDRQNNSIFICAGVAPGSVSLSVPTNNKHYEPEMHETDYIFKPIM